MYWVLELGFMSVAREAPTGDQRLPVHGANQPTFVGLLSRCFRDEILCSAPSPSKNQCPKGLLCQWSRVSPPPYRKERIFPSQRQELLQTCWWFRGLPHATCKAGVGSALAEGSLPLGFTQKCKNLSVGTRTLRAMGLCKQLFAQTNVQQVSVHRWLSVVLAHAPLISVM